MGSGLLSPGHLAVLLVVVLIVFGPKRLPELGRALGSGMRGFKDAINGEEEGVHPSARIEAAEAAPQAAEPLAPHPALAETRAQAPPGESGQAS